VKKQAAIKYQQMGFSVIPVQKNKKPFIKWERYQSEKADLDQIRLWWKEWPNANIGLVTGEISGIDVVDCDSEKGRDALNEFLPDSHIMPISKTPKGWHYFFKHSPGLSNGVRMITDCDLRTTGGYIIVPPSKNGEGKGYAWLQDLSIAKVDPVPMPKMLFDVLQSGGTCLANANSSEHIKMYTSSRGDYKGDKAPKNASDYKRLQVTTGDFKQGERDQALFHLANTLVKGGMGDENILKYLLFFASHCDPPFPEKEVLAKIESAKNRISKADLNISEEVRDYVLTTDGYFLTTDCFNRLQVTTRSEKKAVVAELLRLKTKGIIERHGNKNGCYRRLESDCEPEEWQNACTDTVDIWLPFGLNEMISIMPGSIVLFAGAQDAGKSAVQMNIAKENMRKWNVHYFSSELNASAFKNRMNKFPDLSVDQCPIKFYPRSANFHDVLKTNKNDLNIIDYLEIHDSFYKVSEYLARIHGKIGDAVCIVALQKDPNALYGRGGSFTQEKPILSISLDHGKAIISKFKGEFQGENPRGKEYHFKLLDGCRFKKIRGWHNQQKEFKNDT